MSKQQITLLVIDPQYDFCTPGIYKNNDMSNPLNWTGGGALYVNGADQDIIRLTAMVNSHYEKIDALRVTLDSHHEQHIAHPVCWVDSNGLNPTPFTMITLADVKAGLWRAANPAWQKRYEKYLADLEANGRYPFIIWRAHCLIGSEGTQVMPELRKAFGKFANRPGKMIDWVTKGSHPFTEHYSAVQADVIDPGDPGTQINMKFIQRLQIADKILIAGQALSHCVANTIRDIKTNFGPEHVKKFVLLTDASSPVGDLPGQTMFKDMADAFVKELTAAGDATFTTTTFFNNL